MRLSHLQVDRLRNLQQVDIGLDDGLNLILGANGSGKSSLLEAVHVLAHGRSFRSASPDDLVQRGSDGFFIHSRWSVAGQAPLRLGMARREGGWQLRVRDADVANLGAFVAHCATVAITPDSQRLVSGSADGRRRYLDWLLFHVEHDFLDAWRRYQRALRQRNHLLRAGADPASLEAWEAQMAPAGEAVTGFRLDCLGILEQAFVELAQRLVPTLDVAGLAFRRGWPADMPLAQALAMGRDSDRERGFSQRGPQRADWRVRLADGMDQDQLSRGQAKLVAICCLLAQCRVFRELRGYWPVILLDDLASELDRQHQALLLDWLSDSGAQRLVTGTELQPGWPKDLVQVAARFHVEQGRVVRLL